MSAVKVCIQVDCIKYNQKNEKSPHEGCGHGYVTFLNSYSPPPHDISGTAKARDFKFCTLVRQVTI